MDNQIQGQTAIEDGQPQQTNFLGAIGFSIPKVDSLKEFVKMNKERLKSELAQNEEYVEAEVARKESNQSFKSVKKRALQNPICAEIDDSIKDAQRDLREETKSLSSLLIGYTMKTGRQQVNGLEIVPSARLKKPRRK